MLKPSEGIMKDVKNRLYRFGEVEIDVQNLSVTVSSENRPLEPKSFRLLLFLAENPGRVLPKEEIMAAVWSDTFVSDNSLTRAIAQIRKALDDDPKAPRYIETVPSIGYRFVGVCKEPDPVAMPQAATSPEVAPPSVTRRWPLAATIAVCAGLAIGAAWWMRGQRGRQASAPPKNTTFVQLTDQPGQEVYPSLAPDGKSVIYASRDSGNWDIYSAASGRKKSGEPHQGLNGGRHAAGLFSRWRADRFSFRPRWRGNLCHGRHRGKRQTDHGLRLQSRLVAGRP